MLEQIEQDLRAFADPGTPVIVEKDSAIWEQHGVERSIRFGRSTQGGLEIRLNGGAARSYRKFLAGPEMADLDAFASFILKTRTEPRAFVETTAAWSSDTNEETRTAPATELIDLRATNDLPAFSTRVVLVQGEAGSGKTIALRELARRQAKKYLQGTVDQLYFYVDAQGRALARLEDAMAKDLQDLRSRFSYAAIAPLTRNQLVVPIIDGFDELLGSGGYDEAFASLAAFLSTLNGQGATIASARSAFFDYRNFYDNAQRYSKQGSVSYEVDVVRIEPWTEDQLREYVGAIAEDRNRAPAQVLDRLEELEGTLDEINRRLLTKPFYAARVADLLLEGTTISSGEALIDQLVDAFLEREHRKLLDKNQEPLLSKKGHHAFLVLLAEEMWWQESQRIEVRTVQAVAEMVAESFNLPAGSARAIVERVSSYAFLSTSETERKALRFEHQVFYGYFLAHNLLQCIERERQDLKRFLNRASLDEPLGEQTARLMGSDSGRASRAITSICSVLRPNISGSVARENAGRLIADILKEANPTPANTEFKNVIFKQVRLAGIKLETPIFVRCEFEEVDLSETVLVSPSFSDCDLRHLLLDLGTTRIESDNPAFADQVYSLTVLVGDDRWNTGRYFAPHEITGVLGRVGVETPDDLAEQPEYSEEVQQRIKVLDRFLRKMERRFYVSKEDLEGFSFTREESWGEVLDALDGHGLLEWEIVAKSGPREPLLKLTAPPEVIRQGENVSDLTVPANVRQLWVELLDK